MIIELYSYKRCFRLCRKLRPGFTVGGTVWCLTHTRPQSAPYVEIDKSTIVSPHFKTGEDQRMYLTRAQSEAVRFNNLSGGHLNLDSVLLVKLEQLLNCSLKNIFLITLNSNLKMTGIKSMKELLFLNDIIIPADWKALGLSGPVVRADQTEVTPEQIFAMVRELDPNNEADKLRLDSVAPAVQAFKLATIQAAVTLCPAYNETAIADRVTGLPADQYDNILLNLSTVLAKNPFTHEPSMNAFVALVDPLGESDLSVYEQAKPEDVAEALKGEKAETEPPATDEPAAPADVPATEGAPATETPTETPADVASEPVGEPATEEQPAAKDKVDVISDTAAPALTAREMAMVNARAKSSAKLADMIGTLAGALKDDLEGIVAATAPELPETIEA